MTPEPPGAAGFDAHAESYDADLARGLAASGEDKEYYARGRIAWLAGRLRKLGTTPARILDFGCGDGFAAPFLLQIPGAESVVGVDVSEGLLAVARGRNRDSRIQFARLDGWSERSGFDLAYTNGVFHHIPPDQRRAALDQITAALRPGGILAFWENNPWNPGTRFVMRRIAFDRDAITITPPAGRQLLTSAGFAVLHLDSLFYFPRALGWLRPLEPALSRLPLGGQYLITARRR
jgi:SAM-dependent methyltransferase